MSTTYTSTIEVNVWKEHTCLCCGTVYRYLFKRTKQGTGATPDAASAAAHNAVVSALEHEVDMQPCAGCGSYQPDMIASQRSTRHWWAFWICSPFFLLWIFLALIDAVAYSTMAWFLAATAGLMLLWNLFIDAVNPNANLDGNQKMAEDREERGDLWRPKDRKGEGTGQTIGSGIGAGHVVGHLMLAAALLAFLAPGLYSVLAGLKSNPGWHPEVIGPGDESYVYFTNSPGNSLKGYWEGNVKEIAITNLGELGLAAVPITATTDTKSIPNNIRYKPSETNSRFTVWARVKFPDEPKLAGKTVHLRIVVAARHPHLAGIGNNANIQASDHTFQGVVNLSSPRSGTTFRSLWWLGALAGLTLAIVGGIVLPLSSSAFRKKALPTDIFVPDSPGSRDDDDDDDDDDRRRDDRDRRPPPDRDDGGRDRYRMRDDDEGDDYRKRR